eukprot:2699443-Pleurochrysis_carterae.AAC.1
MTDSMSGVPCEFENDYAWELECEWNSETEEYDSYNPILRKVQEMLDAPTQLAKNADFKGLQGVAAYRIIGPLCTAALNPYCTYCAVESIRDFIHDGGFSSANEAADWLKEYIPPREVLKRLGDDGMSGWHRHVQDVFERTGLLRHIYIP